MSETNKPASQEVAVPTFDQVQARTECVEFAAHYGHLPNVQQALRLAQEAAAAEYGRLARSV